MRHETQGNSFKQVQTTDHSAHQGTCVEFMSRFAEKSGATIAANLVQSLAGIPHSNSGLSLCD